MDVDCKLGSDPLVPTLPASAVQEDVLPVLGHMSHQVVREPEVGGGGAEQLPEFGVMDLDQGFLHLGGTQAQVRVWALTRTSTPHCTEDLLGSGAGSKKYG